MKIGFTRLRLSYLALVVWLAVMIVLLYALTKYFG
jgi:hypothetical protein